MARERVNGLPVKPGQGWVILRLHADEDFYFPLEHTVRTSRRASIEVVGTSFYRRARRRGEMIAVHCALEPICLPSTAGDADRRVIDTENQPPEEHRG